MGMVLAKKNIMSELSTGNLKLKKSVPDILKWFNSTSDDPQIRQAAGHVIDLMAQFRQERRAQQQEQLTLFDLEDEEDNLL